MEEHDRLSCPARGRHSQEDHPQSARNVSSEPGQSSVPRAESQASSPVPVAATDPGLFDRALNVLRSRETARAGTNLARDAQTGSAQTRPEPERRFNETIPARMLNEFVYCPRLFYYEFVEDIFVENADTLRGTALHRRVDREGTGLPPADQTPEQTKKRKQSRKQTNSEAVGGAPKTESTDEEIIHARSISMGSQRLGVTAKIDLVEVRPMPAPGETGDLFARLEVCPVDYKAGAPKNCGDDNELWAADKVQLGVQALILRDNGYICHEGIVYYRGTKQRVHLAVTPELEQWVVQQIEAARRCAAGPIPPPLVNSPKCPRCSLVTVCLPDETRHAALDREAQVENLKSAPPRRLVAPRDDARALYLNTQGLRVGRKDELLQVKEDAKVIDEVRISDTSHVALFGNIQISTQAVQALCEAEVPITYFSMGGWFYGITRGHELKNVFLRIEQFRLARDSEFCLGISRQFVHGKIRNHRTMLMRNHIEPPPAALSRLKQSAESALRAQSIDELLGIEGNGASAYFEQFSGMIKTADELSDAPQPQKQHAQLTFNFNFTHRNRRPPADPVNAMLSLAYSLLAKDCTLAVLAVGFDPYVGFFHQPRFGRPALALDLMEEFRPLVAESAVLSCINNRAITERDFVRAGQAVNLTATGRRRFFEMYEQRMNSLLTHPVFDYKVSYRRALELQARMLAKVITGEIREYVPLMTR